MSGLTKIFLVTAVVLAILISVYLLYSASVVNPGVTQELLDEPGGERAAKVMLITFADGRQIPVNYLKEGDKVFAGADGRWWRALKGGGAPVTLLIQGETLSGYARVILDDPEYKEDVFSRLRWGVPEWLPDWLDAKLVEVTLDVSEP